MLNEIIKTNEAATIEAFCLALRRAKVTGTDPARLESMIFNLAATDMHFLELLADNSKLLLEHAGTVFKILAHARRSATSPEARVRIRLMAERLGFGPQLKKAELDLESFTASQKAALKVLHAMAELAEDSTHEHASSLRLMGFLTGPSGVGKTHTVRAFAEQINRPMLRLSVGDWIVCGAKQECTYHTLLKEMEKHPQMVVFVDEICKMGQHHENSAWSASVLTELFGLLDKRISYSGTAETPWKPEHDLQLKRDVLIVGAGTFQNVWTSLGARRMGFTSSSIASASVAEAVRKAQLVPEELLNRFTDPWLLIEPYTVEDFVRLTRQRKISRRVVDPVKAAASGLNYRYVESAVTADAVKKQIKLMAERNTQTNAREVQAA